VCLGLQLSFVNIREQDEKSGTGLTEMSSRGHDVYIS
jgi:hypothetical protein